MKKKNKFIF